MKHKNSLGAWAVSVGIVVALAVSAVPAAFAQSLGSASLSISVTGSQGTSYQVGQPWALSMTSSLKSASVSLCGIDNKGVQTCTPVGTTDASGGWTLSGSFDATTVGSWTEWMFFPSQNVSSNQISFTVAPAATTPGSCTGLQLQQGTCGSGSTGTQPALCTTGFPMNLVPPGGYQHMTIQVCSFGSGCYTETPITYLTLDSANFLGSALGATVVGVNNPLGDSNVTFSGPEYELLFPNNFSVPAGAISHLYELGDEPTSTSFSGGAQFTQLQQSICGPGPAVTGSGSGGTTGTGGGSTGTGTGSTGGTAGTGAGSLSTPNSNLNGALAGFSSVLSSVFGQTSGAAGGVGSATSGSGAGSGTTTGGGSANACASSAATTISSSLQTLQSLAGILSSGSTSPAVLTSIQNLINAVAQVLNALAGCISGSSTSGTGSTISGTGSGTGTGTGSGAGTSGSGTGDFSIQIRQPYNVPAQINRGQTAGFIVEADPNGYMTGTVDFSQSPVLQACPGSSCAMPPITISQSSLGQLGTLTIKTTSSTQPGTYTINLTGTWNGKSHSTSGTLIVSSTIANMGIGTVLPGATSSWRYLKVQITKGLSWVAWNEAQVFPSMGAAPLKLTPISATVNPTLLVDGDLSNMWNTNGWPPGYFTLDLGSPMRPAMLSMLAQNTPDPANAQYEVDGSLDGTTFTPIATMDGTGVQTTGKWIDLNFVNGTFMVRQ